jgi:sortase A
MKLIEIALLAFGATLIALFVGAQAFGKVEPQRDVASFAEARQQSIARDQPQADPVGAPAAANVRTAWKTPGDAIIAVLRIPGIELEVPVGYGTGKRVLLRGAGLVEGAALPGSRGNVAITARRDTHFRALKNLALGDLIELETPGSTTTYVVTGLSVVESADVHVLADSGESVLTLVTCCPLYFLGNAPQRSILRAVAAGTPL